MFFIAGGLSKIEKEIMMGTPLVLTGLIGFFIGVFCLYKGRKKEGVMILTASMVLFGLGGSLIPEEDINIDHNQDRAKRNVELAKKEEEAKVDNKTETIVTTIGKEEKEETTEDITSEFDELQTVYLDIDENTTYEALIEKLRASNLFYNENQYTSGKHVKVAFEEGVAKFRHADSGDYVEVSFSNDMVIDHVEYFNNDIFIKLFHYINGTYWEFSDQPEYAGYYIDTYNDKAGNFKIIYPNGNEGETDYLKVDSKEDQFKYMYGYRKTIE